MGAVKGVKKLTAELFKQHRETTDENIKISLENEIISLNFNLALHKSKRFLDITIDEEEILASATVGLFLAVRSYDHTKAAFSTYAGRVIENEIINLLRKQNMKKRAALTPLSLNRVMMCEGTIDTFLDQVVDQTAQVEQKYVNKMLFQELYQICVEILDEIELIVFRNFLLPVGERKSQQELGILLSRAQSTIKRTEEKAIRKLRDYIVEQGWGLELLRG